MTDPLQDDNRLRTILSSWRRSPRYRSEALTQLRVPVPSSRWRELDRELKEDTGRFADWQLFLFSLIGFTIIDFFWLQRWGWA